MASCPGGKYFQSSIISSDYRNVDCSGASEGYKDLAGKSDQLLSLMWELQFDSKDS